MVVNKKKVVNEKYKIGEFENFIQKFSKFKYI